MDIRMAKVDTLGRMVWHMKAILNLDICGALASYKKEKDYMKDNFIEEKK